MFKFNRESSLSSTTSDPYTPLPKALHGQPASTHLRAAAHSRSASASFVPGNVSHGDTTGKRHSYGELQGLGTPPASMIPRSRFVSLPSTNGAFSRGRNLHPLRSQISQKQVPSSEDKLPLGYPHRLRNSDPRVLLIRLNSLLQPESQRIPDHLDVDHLMALHERDMMERDQRDAIKIQARLDRSQNSVVPSGLTVFGTSLREATTHASTATVLGGYEHDLPIVVFRCVQELCRHGMHHHVQLGQQKLDRDRLLALISDFDSEPHFGSQTPLDCSSELREIYVLLTTYLFALPEPILSSEMFEAIWAWCVLPSLRSTDFLVDENHPRCHVPSEAGVRVAQILLRLLPLPNFSLVVYMMGFFQRLPNMGNEDVARAVFVGRSAAQPQGTDGRAERAGMMMRWFLDRWDGISKALLPPPVGVHEEARAVVQAARFRQSWTPRDSPGDFFGSSPSSLSSARAPDAEVTPRIGWSGAQPPARERAQLLRLPSDGLFERSVATSEPDSESISVSSSSALDERLLDVTLEFARDAQGDRRRWNIHGICHGSYKNLSDSVSDDSGYQEDHDDAPPSPQPPEALELSHLQAVRRISVLERELERSDVAVSEAISETFKAREQVAELKAKLRVYEEEAAKRPPVLELKLDERAADDWRAIVQCDTDVLKKQLAEVQKERDDALGILEEIRKVMRARGLSL